MNEFFSIITNYFYTLINIQPIMSHNSTKVIRILCAFMFMGIAGVAQTLAETRDGTPLSVSSNPTSVQSEQGRTPASIRSRQASGNHNIFRHFDLGVQAGTTGIGIDLSTHITDHVRLRVGGDFMPHISVPMSFSLSSYHGGVVTAGNFGKMKDMMYQLTGTDVDDKVEMEGVPVMNNFKFLIDIYPWSDKGWRVTAGFYSGPRRVARAINTIDEMPSLLAVNMYNRFYDYIMDDDVYDKPLYTYTDGEKFLIDPYLIDDLRERMGGEGYMGIHVGDFKDGTPYMMHPDRDGKVKVSAFAKKVKPYAGLGYTGNIGDRMKLDVDCGAMMWGGSPTLVTHDGTDLTHDVVNIQGKPGDYVKLMSKFKVYPVLNIRLSWRIF